MNSSNYLVNHRKFGLTASLFGTLFKIALDAAYTVLLIVN